MRGDTFHEIPQAGPNRFRGERRRLRTLGHERLDWFRQHGITRITAIVRRPGLQFLRYRLGLRRRKERRPARRNLESQLEQAALCRFKNPAWKSAVAGVAKI